MKTAILCGGQGTRIRDFVLCLGYKGWLIKEFFVNYRAMTADRQLVAFDHSGFCRPMDTLREYNLLNRLWDTGSAPWKTWDKAQA